VLAGLIELDGTHTCGRAAALLAGGAIALAGFVWRQRTAANPLIVPTLFGNRGFVSGLILGVVFFAAVAGLLYIVSLYVQLGLHYSALRAALALAPVAAGIVFASVASYCLIATLGRRLIGLGVAVVLAGDADQLWAPNRLGGPAKRSLIGAEVSDQAVTWGKSWPSVSSAAGVRGRRPRLARSPAQPHYRALRTSVVAMDACMHSCIGGGCTQAKKSPLPRRGQR